MESYIGRLLENRYEILEVIGTGGMAVVYKALDHRLNRPVAIKILKDDLSRNQDFRRRFHAESQAVAMVSHPNIVGVYDVSRNADVDYIIMELIEGITLKQYLERKGNLNWRETLHFSMQIARALEHAHSKGIVHRDIKPHNIMILKDGSIKVADFGIARVGSSSSTLTREALGSVHYISPEQARGSLVDNRSDLYSLGVVMYEMLTGKPPYDGETPVSVAIQHINGGAHCPSELATGIPLGLEQITMHAMNSNVDQRYSSATEMLRDMEEFRKNPDMTFVFGAAAVNTGLKPPVQGGQKPSAPRTDAERYVIARTQKTDKRSPEERRAERARKEAQLAEDKRKKILTVAIAAAAVVFVILVVVLVLALTKNPSDGPNPTETEEVADTVYVDDFIGMRLEDIDPAAYPDLKVDVNNVAEAYSDKYDEGYVIRQEPEAGDAVKRGRVVRLTVSKGKDENIMPDFINQLGTDAWDYLKGLDLGLNIKTEEIGSEDITKGYVVRTEPAPGETLTKSQNVTLFLSLGSNKMPKLAGEAREDAEKRLDMMELNLKVSVLEEASDTVPKGYVIRTDPKEESELVKGQRITVYVSLGSNKMPDLIGESKNNAEVLLKDMGMDLKPNLELEESSETVEEGMVCRTEPAAGETLTKGQTVKVYISTGSKYTTVPNVIGMTEAEAKKALEAAKLVWSVGEPGFYEGVEPGLVGG
ncbi:MAG: Stk1 family PASTA domain-containing Ser/Thr kinase, partial [Oscillospiraceae bacterium]|nr:Stk1 family PASTA domain-containing Ser/Thr kinase [Oscillospiraceae bacterium]